MSTRSALSVAGLSAVLIGGAVLVSTPQVDTAPIRTSQLATSTSYLPGPGVPLDDAEEVKGGRPDPASTTTSAPPPVAEVYYATCDEARSAGVAPLRAGDPGYRSGLDRDGDGTACDQTATD